LFLIKYSSFVQTLVLSISRCVIFMALDLFEYLWLIEADLCLIILYIFCWRKSTVEARHGDNDREWEWEREASPLGLVKQRCSLSLALGSVLHLLRFILTLEPHNLITPRVMWHMHKSFGIFYFYSFPSPFCPSRALSLSLSLSFCLPACKTNGFIIWCLKFMRAIKLFIKRPPGTNGENKSLFTLKLIQLVPPLSSLSFSLALAVFSINWMRV